MPRSLTTVLATALGALALGTVAACGGGSSGSGSAAEPLKVATEGTYSPFSFHDPKTNALTGYDVDVVKAVAAKLGRPVQFSETTFDSIFAGLQASRYDVVANQISINPERQALYAFSQPYTVSSGVVVTRTGDPSVKSAADVAGKTSAQSATSNFATTAKDAGATIEAVEGFTQAITLLKQSRVDITINDNLAVLDYLKTSNDKDVAIATEIGDTSEQGFAFRKNSPLAAQFDTALDALRADGTLAKISNTWFGEDVSGAKTAG